MVVFNSLNCWSMNIETKKTNKILFNLTVKPMFEIQESLRWCTQMYSPQLTPGPAHGPGGRTRCWGSPVTVVTHPGTSHLPHHWKTHQVTTDEYHLEWVAKNDNIRLRCQKSWVGFLGLTRIFTFAFLFRFCVFLLFLVQKPFICHKMLSPFSNGISLSIFNTYRIGPWFYFVSSKSLR